MSLAPWHTGHKWQVATQLWVAVLQLPGGRKSSNILDGMVDAKMDGTSAEFALKSCVW